MSAAISSRRRASLTSTTSMPGSITSGVNVVSAHVVLDPGADPAGVLDFLCECLSGDFDIEHSTFQLESSDRRRLEAGSHG